MKKIIAIIGIMVYDMVLSLLATGLGFSTSGNIVQDIPTEGSVNIWDVFDTMEFFWNLLFFQVTADIPEVLKVLFFYLPNVFLWAILIFVIFNRGD